MKMKLSVIPTGGLCNSMRAMATGIAIAKHFQSQVVVYWNNDQGLKANFSDLFRKVSDDIIIVENKKWLYNIRDTKSFILRWPLLCIKYKKIFYNYNVFSSKKKNVMSQISNRDKNILLISCHPMCEQIDVASLFVPIDEIQFEIDKIVRHFNQRTIGVHIRRTDNNESINKSPISAFENMIEKELGKDSNTQFYIASDDNRVKAFFKQKYPRNVIAFFEDTSRNTYEGMRFAVVDLYCLSKTSYIIGSYYSSYSHIASVLGGIEVDYATNYQKNK